MDYKLSSELIVNSPIDGKIESISVTEGQTVKENDVLAQILPENKGKYQIVFWFPNSAISFIKQDD
ncbi:biotin/lipoyl-binding protein [Aggregatibacter kilianii]|uniref:biotin/lipoyl-binding protein n=1 Tax=Aggregatibacter kilianii TaxID=2025884 RepID=UPI001EF5E5C5|nr:HlyD family secretion protein [Aggregatibacter kilianii]